MGILIIDDSVDTQRLLQSVLRLAGHDDVLAAASMKEASILLAHGATISKIDLILLDIDLPEMDGIEAWRRLKTDTRLHETPIIMVTANTNDHVLADAFATRIVAYGGKSRARVGWVGEIDVWAGGCNG